MPVAATTDVVGLDLLVGRIVSPMPSVTFTPFGDSAVETLRSLSARVPEGLIAAPSHGWVRRLSDEGIAARTVRDMVLSLAEPGLDAAGQRLATRGEHEAAIAQSLGGERAPRVLVEALADLHDELAALDAGRWHRLTHNSSGPVGVLAKVSLAMDEAKPWCRVVELAVEALEHAPPLIMFLPDVTDPATGRLLAAHSQRERHAHLHIIAGHADPWYRATLNGWGVQVADSTNAALTKEGDETEAASRVRVSGFPALRRWLRALLLEDPTASVAVLYADDAPFARRLAALDSYRQVTVGPVGDLAGVGFDHVVVIDGPDPIRIDNGLFDDQARLAAGGAVLPLRTIVDRHRHLVWAAMAGATEHAWLVDIDGLGSAGAGPWPISNVVEAVAGPATFAEVVAESLVAHLAAGGAVESHEAALGGAGPRIAHRLSSQPSKKSTR